MVISLFVMVLKATLVASAVCAVLPSLYACRRYMNQLLPQVQPFILSGDTAELGDYPRMKELPILPVPTVLNGKTANMRDYPHLAALGYDDPSEPSTMKWMCGGTLISDRHILTAAHCVVSTSRKKPPVRVLLGAVDINDTGFSAQNYRVQKIILHPEYSAVRIYNDIALIELDRTVRFSDHIQPACLYTKSDIPEFGLEVIGWGDTYNSRPNNSPTLQYASLSLVPNDECNESYVNDRRVNRGVQDTMLCASYPEDKMNACVHSGGPLQVKTTETTAYSVVGVTSYGLTECGGSTPDIYTRVSKYVDWIESMIWN